MKDAADVEVQAIKLNDVLQQMRSKSKIQVIILDACRNNPFPRKDYWLRGQLLAASGTGLVQAWDGRIFSAIILARMTQTSSQCVLPRCTVIA
ncbi:hypothetical protein [Mesorhizobium sp.]|uniref:hypothetical protein n=1 Tax=Mesorhizobium sp. TaxID=1871066 RepID=UPI00257E6181|nr:hypothetical protein [Mesorhizobium sp.]